jgi:predicted P-loop ATPase/GTPase
VTDRQETLREAGAATPPALDVERWYEAVSDALVATTEGTDYAEAPEPSDEPKSPYVMRLTHELLARLHPAEYNAIFGSQMS